MTMMGRIKRAMMRALQAAKMPEGALAEACEEQVAPRPLRSDINQARRDLEAGGLIVGARNVVTGETWWALTTEGELEARKL